MVERNPSVFIQKNPKNEYMVFKRKKGGFITLFASISLSEVIEFVKKKLKRKSMFLFIDPRAIKTTRYMKIQQESKFKLHFVSL